MAATYVVGTTFFDAVASTDRLPGITSSPDDPTMVGIPGGPLIETGALFALWNGPGSNRKITIIDLLINEMQARTAAATTNNWNVQRISALSGGLDCPVIKLDQNYANLPSQVRVSRRATCTLTGSQFRRILDLPQLNATRTIAFPSWRRVAGSDMSPSMIYRAADSAGAVQGLVLRSNEGVVVCSNGNASKENWPVEICVWFNDGTNYYLVREVLAPGNWDAPLAVFNGAGSGVTLTITRIEVSEVMQDTTTLPVRLSVESICGFHRNSKGDALEVMSMDSTNPALPSQIVAASPATVIQASYDSGIVDPTEPFRSNAAPLRRLLMAPYGASAGLASAWGLQGLGGSNLMNSRFDSKYGDTGFVLRPGEGVAVFQRDNMTGWGQGYWMRLVFTVDDLPASTSYSRAETYYVS